VSYYGQVASMYTAKELVFLKVMHGTLSEVPHSNDPLQKLCLAKSSLKHTGLIHEHDISGNDITSILS